MSIKGQPVTALCHGSAAACAYLTLNSTPDVEHLLGYILKSISLMHVAYIKAAHKGRLIPERIF